LLPVALQTASWFSDWQMRRWVTTVTTLALQTNDALQQRTVVEALRQAARTQDLRNDTLAIPAAIARIAVAQRDKSLLREAQPALLKALSDEEYGIDGDYYYLDD